MKESLGERTINRAARHEGNRSGWLSMWQELSDTVQPRKANINDNGINTASSSPDQESINRLHDTTAMMANQTLANGQMSNITPMGSQWFILNAPEGDTSYDVQNWFQRASQIMARELAKSNFYSAMDEFYLDRGGFGTAAMFCRMGNKGRLVFSTLPIGSYSIGEDEERQVDTLFRTYKLTPRQMAQRFDESELPSIVKEYLKSEDKREEPMEVIHAVEPRDDYDPSKIDAENMPIASTYVLKQTKEVIRDSGFYESPFAVSRWRLWGESVYGWCPGIYALPTAYQLNFNERCLDVAVERQAYPAWLIPSSFKSDFDPRPFGENVYDASPGGDAMKPEELRTYGRVELGMERSEQKRQVVRELFFEDLFRLLSRVDKQMTAVEVRELMGEKASQFHPFFARLTTELLIPILKRAFSELLRNGKFPDPPKELFTRTENGWEMDDPDIEFSSRLALALQLNETNAISQTIDVLAPIAQFDPGVFDFIDTAKAGPMIGRSLGISADVMRSADEIARIQQGRMEAQQAEAEAAQAQQLSGAVKNMGGMQQMQKDLS